MIEYVFLKYLPGSFAIEGWGRIAWSADPGPALILSRLSNSLITDSSLGSSKSSFSPTRIDQRALRTLMFMVRFKSTGSP